MKPATVKGANWKPKRIGPKRKRLESVWLLFGKRFELVQVPYRGNRKPKEKK